MSVAWSTGPQGPGDAHPFGLGILRILMITRLFFMFFMVPFP
jgi:hypothetical protein